uniref:Uncharacterized protein n=3 Tax=Sphaerodactylus townsendi TaxID=933632 RepID=A0ACB8F5K0_9SAUR
MKNLRAVADLEQLSENLLQSQPLIIKTGQYRSYDEMKHFQSLYPDLINFVVHEDSAGARSSCSGQGLLFHFFR